MRIELRSTMATQRVLCALMADRERELDGVEVGEAAEFRSGTVHPALARLEHAGWVASRWEDLGPEQASRPPRRLYRLTADGVRAARALQAATPRPASARRLRPQVGAA